MTGHLDWVNTVSWSPDGTRLASGSDDKTVKVWDPATGQQLCQLRCDSTVQSVLLLANSTLVTGDLHRHAGTGVSASAIMMFFVTQSSNLSICREFVANRVSLSTPPKI